MAENSKLTGIELNGVLYSLGKSIYEELDMSLERFAELLGRDLYCPTLSSAPTSSTLTYTDTDGETHHFQAGQPCRWSEGADYRIAVCKNITSTASSWYVLPTKVSELTNDSGYAKSSALADVATSGSYNDLSDKPSIPSAVTESTVSGWGFTKNTGTYSKPSTGIPKTDLASAVQTSLGKADTALQSYTEKYTGTITGIKMNGSSKGTSGVVDLGTVITSHQDISGKLDATVAESTYLTKTDAASTYLGKTAKAASAASADSATKATQDASGNVITSTYATKSALSGLQTQLNTLVSGNASSAIESFNEITAFLEGVEDTETLDGIIAGINTEIGKKADKSSAITNITRDGTTFTATRADGTTFTFTQQDSDTTYSSKSAASGGTAVSLVTTGEKYTWNSKQDAISDLASIRSGASKGATAVQPSSLADVATSGSYNDLSDKPSIPSAVTESTVSGWGFTKNTGTYSKPSTGIPKTDLASAVQTSLGKADTALQSYTEKYTGTITGIKMNGSSKGTSGVVDLGTVITTHQDISGKQDKLVSGTSIKTINGVSLLGSGNIGMIWATATNGVDYPSVTIN